MQLSAINYQFDSDEASSDGGSAEFDVAATRLTAES
jgi:hypothetical protein